MRQGRCDGVGLGGSQPTDRLQLLHVCGCTSLLKEQTELEKAVILTAMVYYS